MKDLFPFEYFGGGYFRESGFAKWTTSHHIILKGAIARSVKNKVISYPSLKKLEFYKVFGAYEAFQKIEQYIANELVDRDVIDHEVSDKLKIQSHGFDEFSFRRSKSKKNMK
tara:strand:+ start:38329 stop:38664 length:336 start_codon:yes stop_codon:yes gene_type:complete